MLQNIYRLIYTEDYRFLFCQEFSLAKGLRVLVYAEKQTRLCQSLTFSDVYYVSLQWLILSCKRENPFETWRYHSIPQMQCFPNSF